MSIVFDRPHALVDKPLHYCPGCTHGIIHRLVAEVIDELGIEGKTVGVSPVGCTYNNYEYFNCDMVQAAHGRAPAVATGVKRSDPENNIVFTYQGDGDLTEVKAGMGWEIFTDTVISHLNSREKPMVFLLWGANARSKKKLITNPNHLILETVHPSPLSAYNGFFGCRHFSKAKAFLQKNGTDIDWSL